MKSFRVMLPLALATIACAADVADFQIVNAATGFLGWKVATGLNTAKKAYSSCVEKNNDGTSVVKGTGAQCIFNLVEYTFGAAFSIVGGGYGVTVVQEGFGNAKESTTAGDDPPSRLMRRRFLDIERRESNDQSLLDTFNQRLTGLQGSDGFQASAVVPSRVHPNDGFAFKFNIQDDNNNALHLHTNGTHAMAMFNEDDVHQQQRRQGFLDTDNHYFEFSGLSGLKIEWHNINHDPDNTSDLDGILNPWVISDLMPAPILSTSDVWDFQACNTAKTATFLYGRLIFELNAPGFNYEALTPHGCSSG